MQFDPRGSASLEWSHACSKPRTDAFGGGAAFISARNINSLSTAVWLPGLLAIIERLLRRSIRSVKRSASCSPSTGSAKAHTMEQQTLLTLAFTIGV